MVVRGHIENGVVVIDEPVTLPEGEVVQISMPDKSLLAHPHHEASDTTLPTLAEVFKDIIGKAEGLPSDASENHDHYLYGTPKR